MGSHVLGTAVQHFDGFSVEVAVQEGASWEVFVHQSEELGTHIGLDVAAEWGVEPDDVFSPVPLFLGISFRLIVKFLFVATPLECFIVSSNFLIENCFVGGEFRNSAVLDTSLSCAY